MNNKGPWERFQDVFRRPNNAVIQLIVINVAVFVVIDVLIRTIMGLANAPEIYGTIKEWLVLPAWMIDSIEGQPFILRQIWSPITYMFLHGDFLHLLFNMLFLYWFGMFVQNYLGSDKVVSIYVLGGLAGGLAYILLYNFVPLFEGQRAILLGASGAVFAIVAAAATYLPNTSVHLMFLGPVKLKYIALFYVVLFVYRLSGNNAGGEAAHLGGALLGYLYIRQYQKGRDIGLWVTKTLAWIKNIFKPKPKIRVTYRNTDSSSRSQSSRPRKSAFRASTTTSPASTEGKDNTSQAEIDAILDKISAKGYESLSKEEKQKLFNASKK